LIGVFGEECCREFKAQGLQPLGFTTRRRKLRLVLFFTRGVSLATWDRAGMFDREVAIYQRLQRKGAEISFVSYGGRDDLKYARRIPAIRILCNRWHLAPARYERWIPWLHWRALHACDLIKTNQTDGGDVALRAAQSWHKPLVARCGYLWSANASRSGDEAEARIARRIEHEVFGNARAVVVTTPAMADDLAGRISGISRRVRVIPNYVDTERFRPEPGRSPQCDLIFVGRLAPEKNVESLLDAVRPLDVTLTLIGNGPLRDLLRSRFGDLGARVQWHDAAGHRQLPRLLNQARAFVLPSHYEGHPKALIEAMACGLPVIGGDSPGIRELVRHGETGWLCGTDAGSIRQAVETVLVDEGLRQRLGANARRFAVERFSLDRIAEMEWVLLNEVVHACRCGKAA